MNKSVNAAAESLRDDMAAFLREIVAIPSPCGQEGDVIERLRTTMLDFGYDEVRVDKMGNLLGRIGAGPRLIACRWVPGSGFGKWQSHVCITQKLTVGIALERQCIRRNKQSIAQLGDAQTLVRQGCAAIEK